jgi:hypothetical protein
MLSSLGCDSCCTGTEIGLPPLALGDVAKNSSLSWPGSRNMVWLLALSEIALTKLVSIYVRILLYDRILHHQYYIYLSSMSTASTQFLSGYEYRISPIYIDSTIFTIPHRRRYLIIVAHLTVAHLIVAMASRRSRANSVQPSTDSYSSKWGRVVVFNRENYPTFSLTCKAALVALQSWSIVNGTERDPRGDAEADFNTRRNLAIQIIFLSVSQDYVYMIAPFLDISDLKGMWDKLKTLDRGRDSVFVANICAQFAKEIFDPMT